MGQVAVTLNGRTYRLRCADGEEERLHALVDHIREKLSGLTEQFGQAAGNERLMLMAAILITDELFEYRDREDNRAA